MKKSSKILLFLMLLLSNINLAQEFNGYKYIIVSNHNNKSEGEDEYFLCSNTRDYFKSKELIVVQEKNMPDELRSNPCLALLLEVRSDFSSGFGGNTSYGVSMDFRDCKQNSIKKFRNSSSNELASAQKNYDKSLKRCFNDLEKTLENYSFDSNWTPKIEFNEVENINKDEVALKSYYDNSKLDPIEGIYKTYKSVSNYKLGIIKVGDFYKAIVIDSDFAHWKQGDVKAIFESTSAEGVFSAKYFLNDKTAIETFANLEGGLINLEFKNPNGENEDIKLLKLYPKN
jgi:hypothetical protein